MHESPPSEHPNPARGADLSQLRTTGSANDAARSNQQGESFLTTKEAASYLRLSKSYLDKLRVYGGGPEFIRLGQRKIVYAKSDLDAWAGSRRFRSTSEYQRSG